MDINLNLLKFHSFNYKKKIHNEWHNKHVRKHVHDEIIMKQLKNYIKHIKKFNCYNELMNDIKKNKSNHAFDKNHILFLIEIIQKCHPLLYNDITQICEEMKYEEYNIFQLKINNKHRLVCLFKNNIIYPLLLDINHCFYKTNKTYDNNKNTHYPWDFKSEQDLIKDKLK